MLGDLDPLEPERRASPRRAGSSPRRSWGRGPGQADHPRGGRLRSSSASRASSSSTVASSSEVAVDALGVVGVELLVDRRPPRWRCRPPRSRRHRPRARSAGRPSSRRAAHVRGERLQLLRRGRVGVDVALAHAHHAGVQRDVEAGACARPRRRTRWSRRRCRSRPSARSRPLAPDIAPRNVSWASSLAAQHAGVEPEVLADALGELGPVGGVADGRGEHRDVRLAAVLVDLARGTRAASRRPARRPPRRARRSRPRLRPGASPASAARAPRRSRARRRRRRSAAAWSSCRCPPPRRAPRRC